MRKLIILGLLIILSVSAYAFERGTVNPAGLVSFTSYKQFEDSEPNIDLSINSQVGYFVRDNISFDFGLDFRLINEYYQGSDYDRSRDEKNAVIGFGIGVRFFLSDNFYLGGLISRSFFNSDNSSYSGLYYNLTAGSLVPVVKNVYFNLAGVYQHGIGGYYGDISGDNEESGFRIAAGFSIFLKKK
jgi:hypothetical protein